MLSFFITIQLKCILKKRYNKQLLFPKLHIFLLEYQYLIMYRRHLNVRALEIQSFGANEYTKLRYLLGNYVTFHFPYTYYWIFSHKYCLFLHTCMGKIDLKCGKLNDSGFFFIYLPCHKFLWVSYSVYLDLYLTDLFHESLMACWSNKYVISNDVVVEVPVFPHLITDFTV